MGKLKIRGGDWVVVCDGNKALMLENVGDDKFLNLKTKEVYQHPASKTHEQGTSAPGRAFSSVDPRRSAIEQTDWHEQAEREFLQRLVGRLDSKVGSGEIRHLVLIAPPRALGVIRQACSAHMRGALRAELDKDLVKLPVYEIERHLAARA